MDASWQPEVKGNPKRSLLRRQETNSTRLCLFVARDFQSLR
jgi:hypothetical protein